MTLEKYTIKVTEPQYWEEIHDLLCTESSCEHIPNRIVSCCDEKLHSPTRGTFILEESEVEKLKNHPNIEWIELDPTENKDKYPKPDFYIRRWNKDVKIYRDLGANAPPTSNPTSAELDRTGWQVIRTGIKTNGDFWGTVTGNPPVELGDASYSLTGKNVDVIIHDSGVLQYHPEFLDENGQSRVRDIVLDGPYYIDQDYFDTVIPGVRYTKPDGRVGIATTAAHEWWNNSSKRSVGFSTIGTVTVNSGYTLSRALGTDLDGTNTMSSGHGTSSASLVAGKSFGIAIESNIWNMSGIGEPAAMNISIEQNYDLMKIFHQYKPINPVLGVKNPTIINGSWGYQAAFEFSTTGIAYTFRDSPGTFDAADATTDIPTAWKNGFNNQVGGAYKSWSSSSRSSSTDTSANEMMSSGTIYVAAAGNNNQRLGIGLNDPDLNNVIEDRYFFVGDPRFGGLFTPTNHRNWMNPQGIGYDSINDFHPVICVGAMDEFIESSLAERQASYSNNGPGIDVWSPADETLAAGTNGVIGYTDYERYDDSRFFDNLFNGTSAAAPVACGVIALYLQINPTATSKETKDWLKKYGSVVVENSQYIDPSPDDNTTAYWTGFYNLRGAERRIVYNNSANDIRPSSSGVTLTSVNIETR